MCPSVGDRSLPNSGLFSVWMQRSPQPGAIAAEMGRCRTAAKKNGAGPDFSRDRLGDRAESGLQPGAGAGTTARNFTSAPKASSLLSTGAVSEHRASAGRANPGPARTYLTVALIVWFGGAAVGIATLPRREGKPAGAARPPAHRPVDI